MNTNALELAGRRYQDTRRKFDAARDELHPLILEAVRAGVPQTQIVKLTGMTRDNIRVLARKHGITAVPGVPERKRANSKFQDSSAQLATAGQAAAELAGTPGPGVGGPPGTRA